MKKTLLAAAAIVMFAVLLAGCGKTQATKDVEALIAGIGDVNTESGDAINDAREAFDKLSAEEKNKVKNTSKLENAENEYKAIIDFNSDIQKILSAADSTFSDESFNVSELLKRAEEISAEYGEMSEARKAQVKDFEKISAAKAKLSVYCENAVRAASQYVKAFDKVHIGEAYTITDVYCIKQIRNDTDEYHLFALTYKDSSGEEETVYSHARCLTEVTSEAIAAREETFFAEKPVTEDADAKKNGNVELDIASVLALASE